MSIQHLNQNLLNLKPMINFAVDFIPLNIEI